MSAFEVARRDIVAEMHATLGSISPDDVEVLIGIVRSSHRVFFVGVGRVLLALEAVAKRWAHLGIDTVVVGQITEPAITERDVLIVGSGSGESVVPLAIASRAKQHGARVVHIGSNPSGSMSAYSDHFVRIPTQTKLALENEVTSLQPMTSLFEQCLLLLGDAIALMLVRADDIDMHTLWRHHANLE
ncbi:6-phospho-3-hexuloisomerase [Microbacterium sp. PMB16]|uniref:6-phospho-3-hexuloisomerase n=1 Tax=Microbacterium sp. PMB16 TaxID=3120157 RepID=UPI003F4C00BC